MSITYYNLINNAINEYNDIMILIGREIFTINTKYSIDNDLDRWNLRDMVAECDYVLNNLYFKNGSIKFESRLDNEITEEIWVQDTKKLMGFIQKYKTFAMQMKCYICHDSIFD